uniref:ATP synthase protein 8 n=1 Tax=Candida bohioensis TaxID=561986 RepID=U3MF28_9ASCO|nr:ATP synthase F0 subunit 8 [Candida bohioensis]AGW07363.1 ATP synthase F0 subunit 8 [Candida bohioensis]
MPQTVPFYFMNLMSGLVLTFAIAMYLSATIMLPSITSLMVARNTTMRT